MSERGDQERGKVYVAGLIDRDGREKTWRDWAIPAVVSGLVGLIVTVAVAFGGRVVGSGETTAVLTTQVQTLIEGDREQRKLLLEMTTRMGELYTRREAQADREAAERRFQSMEGRISDLGRRLEIVETSSRMLQQTLIDRGVGRK